MNVRDSRDVVCGAVLCVGGLAIAVYAVAHYDLGTVNRMGPGMFPAALGVIMAGLGLLVFVPALFRRTKFETVEWRVGVSILASVGAFATVIAYFGLIPAIVFQTLVAATADEKIDLRRAAVLAAALSLAAFLIFHVGLGIPAKMFKWPG